MIRVGGSAGVLWEIEQALTLIPRERLALFLVGSAAPAPELATRLAPVLGAELTAFTADESGTGLGGSLAIAVVSAALSASPAAHRAPWPLSHWPPWNRDFADEVLRSVRQRCHCGEAGEQCSRCSIPTPA